MNLFKTKADEEIAELKQQFEDFAKNPINPPEQLAKIQADAIEEMVIKLINQCPPTLSGHCIPVVLVQNHIAQLRGNK